MWGPLVSFISFEVWPLFVMMQLTSVYSKRTHFLKPSPKFIFCITLSKICQFRWSKAFSWSRQILAIRNCFEICPVGYFHIRWSGRLALNISSEILVGAPNFASKNIGDKYFKSCPLNFIFDPKIGISPRFCVL